MKSQRGKNAKVNQPNAATLVSKVYKGRFEFLNYLFSLFFSLYFLRPNQKQYIPVTRPKTKNCLSFLTVAGLL